MTDQELNSSPDGGDVHTPAEDSVSPVEPSAASAPAETPAGPAAQQAPAPAEQPAPVEQSALVETPAPEAPAPEAQPEPPAPECRSDSKRKHSDQPTAVVRYGLNRNLGEFRYNPSKIRPVPSQKVVIRTERGVELGTIVSPIINEPSPTDPDAESGDGCGCSSGGCGGGECGPSATPGHSPLAIRAERLRELLKTEGNDYPFRRGGRVLRAANPQDLIDYRHFKKSSAEASQYCKKMIIEMKLPMRLVSVEHLIGGERIIFYFNSEERVDFRALVKDLASRFRTRIEMRQVGARDEARLVGDYERCGQRCCCQQYLKLLKPISMRMAKVQKATLDPSKISGRCGRLMCCLRYEDETYTKLKKNLPRKSSWIRTETLLGRVLDSQILTQLTRIALPDRTLAVIPIADIVERDLPEPSEDDLNAAVRDMNRARRQAQQAAAGNFAPAEPTPAKSDKPAKGRSNTRQGQGRNQDQDKSSDAKPKREGQRRRRRGSRRGNRQGANSPKPQQGAQQNAPASGPKANEGSSAQSGEKPKRLVKRRRRRRRKPSGGQGGGQGQGGAPQTPPSN